MAVELVDVMHTIGATAGAAVGAFLAQKQNNRALAAIVAKQVAPLVVWAIAISGALGTKPPDVPPLGPGEVG